MQLAAVGAGAAYRLQQHVGVHRFLQQVEGALLEETHRGGDIRLAGEEDDGKGIGYPVERLLQLATAHPRHAEIEDQATRLVEIRLGQEAASPVVALQRDLYRLQQPAQRRPYCGIVVHQIDVFSHGCAP
ncbi:hypothetical protein D3C75_442890 [compost metagenome]